MDINVGAGNWVNEDLLSLICGQIKVVGNPKAINVGFLLAPLLDGAFAEAVYGALGESTERNPKAFLTALQSTMKMYKKKKKDEMFYKYDFRYISAQTDLEYVDQPELEVAAYRKRKKILSGIRNSDLKEARDYSLKVLDDGIMELSQHVEN